MSLVLNPQQTQNPFTHPYMRVYLTVTCISCVTELMHTHQRTSFFFLQVLLSPVQIFLATFGISESFLLAGQKNLCVYVTHFFFCLGAGEGGNAQFFLVDQMNDEGMVKIIHSPHLEMSQFEEVLNTKSIP